MQQPITSDKLNVFYKTKKLVYKKLWAPSDLVGVMHNQREKIFLTISRLVNLKIFAGSPNYKTLCKAAS